MNKPTVNSQVQPDFFGLPTLPQVHGDDWAFLRGKRSTAKDFSKTIRVADLFSGCGGISLGLKAAAADYGFGFEVALAADFEPSALNVYKENLAPLHVIDAPLNSVFSLDPDASSTLDERRLARTIGQIDVLVGGPPCQGHSDLNNNTRRNDPKNSLYFLMARAASILRPRFVVIENVSGAMHDRGGVVDRTLDALASDGYKLDVALVDGLQVGIPQRRKRLVIVGSLDASTSLAARMKSYERPQRDVRWAIEDLVDCSSVDVFDQAAQSSADTRKRIDFLFDNDAFDLPDSMRPACHRDKKHSYRSVYGRLSWDQPAQTITSGFYSMCMGRYVHPSRRRTLTAHEAARLQFFPDSFSFQSVRNRTNLATIIGNAVPPKLAYIVGVELMEIDAANSTQKKVSR